MYIYNISKRPPSIAQIIFIKTKWPRKWLSLSLSSCILNTTSSNSLNRIYKMWYARNFLLHRRIQFQRGAISGVCCWHFLFFLFFFIGILSVRVDSFFLYNNLKLWPVVVVGEENAFFFDSHFYMRLKERKSSTHPSIFFYVPRSRFCCCCCSW